MKTIKNFTFGLLLSLGTAAVAFAQAGPAEQLPAPPAPTITVSVSAKGVRFAALGVVKQIRLEVFGEGRDSVYDSGFKAGNVYDWGLKDEYGQLLRDGAYVFVVTFRDASGRVGMQQGGVLIEAGRPSFQLGEAEQSGAIAREKGRGSVADNVEGALTL